MLATFDAIATIAVRDVVTAGKFYEGTLGLEPRPAGQPGVRAYQSRNSALLVYQSSYAGTNKATAATWVVDDVDGIVRGLKTKGVVFEHYDMPNTIRQGDVHVAGNHRAAWFKDPDGNILAVVSR